MVNLYGTDSSPSVKRPGVVEKKKNPVFPAFIIPIGPFKPEKIEVGQETEITKVDLLNGFERLTKQVKF